MRASRGSFQVASFRGIPIRVHFTLLLVLPLLAFAFGSTFRQAATLAEVPPEQLTGSATLWGLGVAVGLFLSVLLHEMAHTLYALRRGGEVRGITLMMVGGVSELMEPPPRPRDEAVMALVGPLASIALAALCGLVTWLLRGTHSFPWQFGFFYLGSLNLFLGVFNLLPAFPMDGGRIVRAALTGRMGFVRATRTAALMGRIFAGLFAIWGIVTLNPFLFVIAVFVYLGAEAEAQQVRMKAALERVPVERLMTPRRMGVDVSEPLDDVLWAMRRERRTLLPVTEERRPVGIIAVEGLRAVPESEHPARRARDIMLPVTRVGGDEDGWSVVRRMAEARTPLLAVVDAEGGLVGTLDTQDVRRGLELHEAREGRDERRRRWREQRPA